MDAMKNPVPATDRNLKITPIQLLIFSSSALLFQDRVTLEHMSVPEFLDRWIAPTEGTLYEAKEEGRS